MRDDIVSHPLRVDAPLDLVEA